jgi:uncharacterized protein (TIGR02996 family)
MNEEVFLRAIRDDPAEPAAWLALADYLQEQGDPRGELLRLTRTLQQPDCPQRPALEERLCRLLAQGVRPCWPQLTNSVGMLFSLIPAGTFRMGSPNGEADRQENEGPQHEVEITRPFYLGVYPITQEQYERLMGTNPSRFSSQGGGKARVKKQDTRAFPVESVSWDDAIDYCRKLSEWPEEKRLGRVYRLPTEAEWEYACRGGASSSTPFHFGNSLSSTQANFNGNHPYGGAAAGPNLRRTTAVGSYPANGFGLYDMHGNVWEWCADWFDANYYATSPRKDPQGPQAGEGRVLRGGSRSYYGRDCRSACRNRLAPGLRVNHLGFRVALSVAARTR